MKLSILKQMIKEEIVNILNEKDAPLDVTNAAQLETEIKTYQANMKTIKELEASIADTVKTIETMQKEEKARVENIMKMMKAFNTSTVKVDKWIAELKTVAKYARIAPDYKDLWNTALTKVNAATKNVLNSIMDAHVEIKKSATKDVLNVANISDGKLVEANVLAVIKNVIGKLVGFAKAAYEFIKLSNSLPAIKR